MDLFSCRNCVQNCAQSPSVGKGEGFCVRHNSVIREPAETTCKYLQRKDLPAFVVDESTREHAAEYSEFPGMVTLKDRRPLSKIPYSERHAWETEAFDPLTHALAQYHKTKRSWILIQALSGGLDGRRSLAHACAVRRYMANCGSWESSYRLVLGLIQEIDVQPHFRKSDLVVPEGEDAQQAADDALWEVVFARLSSIQEYGWHSGLEDFRWITDKVNGGLSSFDWKKLAKELARLRPVLTEQLIAHAREHQVFFNDLPDTPDHWDESDNSDST